MSVKKAKGKGKGTAKKSEKKSAKKSAPKAKKSVDLVRVRENINNLVGASAKEIAVEVIKAAKTGQLASARYLFEAVGLYPPTEQTTAGPIEHSLAHTLLTRMGLPLDPVVCDEAVPDGLTRDVKAAGSEIGAESATEEDPQEGCKGDPETKPAEGED